MVTPAPKERFALVRRSIADYCKQSYPNRELIVVLDQPTLEDLARLRSHVADLGRSDIRLAEVAEKRALGVLRNICVDRAKGPLLCQWDDDDLHHETRLEYQVAEILARHAGAVYLKNTLHLFRETREVYWLDWGNTRLRGHPATLLSWKTQEIRYAEVGDRSKRGEDADVLRQLCEKTPVAFPDNPPYLYTYVFHGGNTWHRDHHRSLAVRASVGRTALEERREELVRAITKADLGIDFLQVLDEQGLVCPQPPVPEAQNAARDTPTTSSADAVARIERRHPPR